MKEFNLKITDEVFEKSEKLFEDLGLDLNTAINVFLRKAIAEEGIPFDVRINNEKEKEKENPHENFRAKLPEVPYRNVSQYEDEVEEMFMEGLDV